LFISNLNYVTKIDLLKSEGLKDMYENSQMNEFCVDKGFFQFCPLFPNPCCKDYGNSTDRCGSNGTQCLDWSKDYLAWKKPGLMRFFVFMPLQFLVQFGIVLMYEAGYFRALAYYVKKSLKLANNGFSNQEDSEQESQAELERQNGDIKKDTDVIEEENRLAHLVQSGKYLTKESDEIFLVDRLTKHYSNFMAVKGISFSLKANDTFGLLGRI
jgi:hypothetical protein